MAEDDFFRFAETIDTALLVSGIVFLFLGFAGVIISVTFYNVGIFKDDVLSFAFGTVNAFMTIMGIFLIMFHGKIIVKPRPQ